MRSLEITTRIGCRLMCGFCPQRTLAKAYDGDDIVLSLDGFRLALSKLDTSVRVDFSGFAEPLLNPDAPKMVAEAKAAGFTVHVYTTLVGLKQDGVEDLKKADFIKIHVPDKEAMKVACEQWIDLHKMFGIGNECYMTMGPMTDRVKDYLDFLEISVEMPSMLSRGGSVDRVVAEKKNGRIKCSANRWNCNVMLPDGSVVACCMDYGLTMRLGNIFADPYETIVSNATTYAANDNPPDSSICRKCEWAQNL